MSGTESALTAGQVLVGVGSGLLVYTVLATIGMFQQFRERRVCGAAPANVQYGMQQPLTPGGAPPPYSPNPGPIQPASEPQKYPA